MRGPLSGRMGREESGMGEGAGGVGENEKDGGDGGSPATVRGVHPDSPGAGKDASAVQAGG